jgi:ornithine cyclodeaminase/alanine dehydrogenase-like protein (mu-crystallin family)
MIICGGLVLVKILLLRSKELEELLSPESLIPEIENAFVRYSKNETVTPPRTVMWVEGNWWGVMQSYVPGYGVGVKTVSLIPQNPSRGLPTIQALVTLFDGLSGSPLAVMEGGVLTALRTGAASAVSAKYLAPRDVGPIGIIGTGYQARYQLRFVSSVYKTEDVVIYDVRPDQMRLFRAWAESAGFKVFEAASSEELVKKCKIVIEASTTKEPVILGKWLGKGQHVISIGAHARDYRALDDEAITKFGKIVVDSRKAVLEETGDVRIPLEKGLIKQEDIAELGEVAAGLRKGREGDELTLFKSVGLAIQDAAAAALAYRLARSRGLGIEVEL